MKVLEVKALIGDEVYFIGCDEIKKGIVTEITKENHYLPVYNIKSNKSGGYSTRHEGLIWTSKEELCKYIMEKV